MNLNRFENFDIVPADGQCERTHSHANGWRIIRSIAPEAADARLLLGRLGNTYHGYTIKYDPPPIPDRRFDWAFVHKDYDGAEDAYDFRCGHARTWDACFDEIDTIEDDQ